MDYYLLTDLAATMGYHLAMSGAETFRVEDTVHRILGAYGIECEVFAIPNSISVSLEAANGKPLMVLRRISFHGNDLEKLEKLNALSRRICAEKPAPDEAFRWLRETLDDCRTYRTGVYYLGNILAGMGFCIDVYKRQGYGVSAEFRAGAARGAGGAHSRGGVGSARARQGPAAAELSALCGGVRQLRLHGLSAHERHARQRGRVLRLGLCRRVHGAELDARRLYHDARPALPRHQADFLQPRHDQCDRRDGAVSAADPAAGDPACTDHAPFQPQHAASDGRAGLSALTRELPRLSLIHILRELTALGRALEQEEEKDETVRVVLTEEVEPWSE